MIKVLHITNWYPNKFNPNEALWIQRHIQAVAPYLGDHYILHLQVIPSNRINIHKKSIAHGIQRRIEVPFTSWFLVEIITAILLTAYLLKLRSKKFDIINFHIAYPLLTYWHIIRRVTDIPAVITEHWSAYHFNFGLPSSSNLSRVKRIFRLGLPVITVSEALGKDLKLFSQHDFPIMVVPNVVDNSVYFRDPTSQRHKCFFMVSQWQWPKRPDIIINAFAGLIQLKEFQDYKLKIGGYGSEMERMKTLVNTLGIAKSVSFLGNLTSIQIAAEMNRCTAFLHCSEYETFSVVCAEAISCGTPVIASAVGGITEFINNENGQLIDSMAVKDWLVALRDFKFENFNSSQIANLASTTFSQTNVGVKYFSFLKQVSS